MISKYTDQTKHCYLLICLVEDSFEDEQQGTIHYCLLARIRSHKDKDMYHDVRIHISNDPDLMQANEQKPCRVL